MVNNMVFEKLMEFLLRVPWTILNALRPVDTSRAFYIIENNKHYLNYINTFFNLVGYFLPMPLIATVLAFMTELRLAKISSAFVRKCKSFMPFMSGD